MVFSTVFPTVWRLQNSHKFSQKGDQAAKNSAAQTRCESLSNPKNFVSLFPFQKPYYHMCKILWFCQFDSWVVLMTYKYGSPQNFVIIGWKLSWFEPNWNSDTEKRNLETYHMNSKFVSAITWVLKTIFEWFLSLKLNSRCPINACKISEPNSSVCPVKIFF